MPLTPPSLGVYPDLGNLTNAAVLYGHDLYEDIESGRGHMAAMHLKDTRPGLYRDLDFGDGHVDFVKGAKAALDQGVRLFVTEFWHDGRADWPGTAADDLRIRQAIDWIDNEKAPGAAFAPGAFPSGL